MGENNNAGNEDEKDLDTENGADNQEETQEDGGADNTDEGAEKSDDEKSDEKEDDEADKGDKKPESKPTPNADDEEPKTRKRNIDFILERKDKKIAKLKEKANGAGAEKEDEEEDDLDSEDSEIIGRHVAKALSPFLAKQMQDEDNQEIGNFVKDNPDFAPYVAKVQKFSQHPSRKDVPISSIFYEVAGKDLMKIGADRAKKAEIDAKKTRAGGGDSNAGGSEKSVWDLSTEEFEAQKESVRNNSRE